ncbi:MULTISPECIES: GNAT family N-acetyltransferase [unclassified Streptomyces]|uniref:GNAT family N-acetyltransferase n=1 Tax=Streptomyces TaxID=1883 RepID=UPI000690AAF0|nr:MULTISPECIES: GNAT family N-acetyltransferase [unclassified Streptomyces]
MTPIAPALLRPATPADLGACARIYAHYVAETVITFDEEPPPLAHWADRLARLTACGLPFLVAETAAGEVAGYAYAGPWRPRAAYRHTVEDTCYLAPGHTGRGLGGLLLGELLTRSAAAGARQMIAVISDAGTDASVALHHKHGFRTTGRLSAVGRKHGRWIDTVLMQRALGDGDDTRTATR